MEAREGAVTSHAAAEGSGSYQPPPPPPPPLPPPTAAAVSEEKPSGMGGLVAAAAAAAAAAAPPGVAMGPPVTAAGTMPKKRGRPRKYGPDGSLLRPLNPIPISASVPAGVEYTPAAKVGAAMKRGRGRAVGLVSKSPQFGLELEPQGEMVACAAGANFTPHVINIAAGEDVTMKIISFSQQGPRAICILSANGIISNVTLRQPDSSGGTLTYEGRFELLSLSGSFMPTENEGTRSRSGGLSVSLASPDGRVVGGGIAGLLVAAGPVQVVVGSFLPSYQMEQKLKKTRIEAGSASTTPPSAIPLSNPNTEEAYGSTQGQHISETPKGNPAGESWSASLQTAPVPQNSATDANTSLPGG
ncbi:AT-hook motif nuclear-localized protein 7-like [Curcuma longa]|uniref:AT-hook motif nuclear-localized protein 7-like n=1 Tax=Curcuma longa TaxID=136217 RepID=UPI003D9DD29C